MKGLDMEIFLNAVMNVLKLSLRYQIGIVIVTGFLLLMNESILSFFGMTEFVIEHRPIIGLAFLSCATLALINLAIMLNRYRIKNNALGKQIIAKTERLFNLTEPEKEILRFYIGFQTRTNVLRYDDGVVRGLEREGIIYRASNHSLNALAGFPMNIDEDAWKLLNACPQLLNGKTAYSRTDEKKLY